MIYQSRFAPKAGIWPACSGCSNKSASTSDTRGSPLPRFMVAHERGFEATYVAHLGPRGNGGTKYAW